MCLPPLSWQTYDIEIKTDGEGNPVATVYTTASRFTTTSSLPQGAAEAVEDLLQDHGDPVVYRNIWVVPSETPKK